MKTAFRARVEGMSSTWQVISNELFLIACSYSLRLPVLIEDLAVEAYVVNFFSELF